MIKRPAFFALLLVPVVLFGARLDAQGKQYSLIAPVYPGSVAEAYPVEHNQYPIVPIESRLQTFHSKDSFEKVKAFYEKSSGKLEDLQDGHGGWAVALVSPTEVMKYLTAHGVEIGEGGSSYDTRGDQAGVTLWGKPVSYNVNVYGVLDKLKGAYLMKFIGVEGEDGSTMSKHLEDPELTKVVAKYEHLQWEHFQTVNGRSMDDALIEKHYTAPAAALTKEQEELVKKMTALTTSGKYDEAGKVGDRMMQISTLATDYKYNWDAAIKCLDEMEVNAYPVKIVIDRPLAEWDLSGVKK